VVLFELNVGWRYITSLLNPIFDQVLQSPTLETMITCLNQFFKQLNDTKDSCPVFLREIFQCVDHELVNHFGKNTNWGFGRVLLEKFICSWLEDTSWYLVGRILLTISDESKMIFLEGSKLLKMIFTSKEGSMDIRKSLDSWKESLIEYQDYILNPDVMERQKNSRKFSDRQD